MATNKIFVNEDEDSTVVATDQFYSNFRFTLLPPRTQEDMQLLSQPGSVDDRILDLLMILDCTSSMGAWIELCKDTLKECIDDLLSQYPDLKPRVGFIGYRDLSDSSNIFLVQDFTFDVAAVKEAISSMFPFGGGDGPEDVQGALYQGLKLNWRDVSVKLCYFCTDAPCHGRQYHTIYDNYPEGNPAGLLLEEIMCEYSDMNVGFTVYDLKNGFTTKMFKIMEESYNKGRNSGQFSKIQVEQPRITPYSFPTSLKAKGFVSIKARAALRTMELEKRQQKEFREAHKAKVSSDMATKTRFQYQLNGWSHAEEGFNYDASKRKAKTHEKFANVPRYAPGAAKP